MRVPVVTGHSESVHVQFHRAIHLWVVADNLRKGAALNAAQSAERL